MQTMLSSLKIGNRTSTTGEKKADLFTLFENTLNKALGSKMRKNDNVARFVWAALTKTTWMHDLGTVQYSDISAANLVARIKGNDRYTDWYQCMPPGLIHVDVAKAMKKYGWTGTSHRDRRERA